MANTLKFGNGNFATKAGSTLCYDDQNGNFKPIPMDFSRNSIGTRVNKQGLIEVMQADIPRIDYTDSDKGVALLEPSRTNSLVQSNQFNTTWVVANSTVTSNYGVSPSGNNNAWKIQSTAVNSETRVRQSKTFTIGQSISVSCFMKSGNVNYGIVRCWAINAGGRAWFNLSNGTIETVDGGVTAKIEKYANGWYRCIISGTVTVANAAVDIAPSRADNEYLSGALGENILIYGAQLEVGSFPTSYIPTSGSVVQRAADVANNAGNSEVFSDTQGVLFADIAALVDSTSGGIRRLSLSDGTNDNRIQILLSSVVGRIGVVVKSGGLFQIDTGFLGYNTTYSNKIAIRYGSGVFKVYINGLSVFNDAGVSFSSISLNNLRFSNPYGVETMYSKIKQIQYFDSAIADTELEYLTSYRSLSELVKELNLNTL